MTPPEWLLAVLRRSRLARTPKQVTPRVYGSTTYISGVRPDLEHDTRRVAPPADDRQDVTRQILPLHSARHLAGDRFPHNAATPRIRPGRAQVPDWQDNNVDGAQNRGRFQ